MVHFSVWSLILNLQFDTIILLDKTVFLMFRLMYYTVLLRTFFDLLLLQTKMSETSLTHLPFFVNKASPDNIKLLSVKGFKTMHKNLKKLERLYINFFQHYQSRI